VTQDEATRQVKAFFKAHEVNSPGLNAKGLGGAMIGTADVYFEYQSDAQALKCSALIYRFRGVPKPQVVAAFQAEEKAMAASTGGGRIDYQAESRGVYLSRSYSAPVEAQRFAEDMKALMDASDVWRTQVVAQVADRAYGRRV
jgi:hypothetical protein